MKNVITITIAFWGLMLLSSPSVFAKEGAVQSEVVRGTTLTVNKTLSVEMPVFSNDERLQRFAYLRGITTLKVDADLGYLATVPFQAQIRIKLTGKVNGNVDFNEEKLLSINYNPENGKDYKGIDVLSIPNANLFSCTILDIQFENEQGVPIADAATLAKLKKMVSLQTSIEYDQYFNFMNAYGGATPAELVSFIQLHKPRNFKAQYDSPNNTLKLTWDEVKFFDFPFSEGYELEYSFVDDYGTPTPNGQPTFKTPQNLAVNFKNNATRVLLQTNSYELPVVNESGYYVFRLRAYGKTGAGFKQLVYGPYAEDLDDQANKSVSELMAIKYAWKNAQVHENDGKNWQAVTTFAEEGKRKTIVKYMDGTLRARQMVTGISSDKSTIVAETIYDQEGREAVQVLPTPVAGKALKYYKSLNKNEQNAPFTYKDFDQLASSACSPITPPKLNTNSGASNYYSPQNPDKKGFNAFVPDAEGYPYSRIIYTNDNTGRIAQQGNVGKDFQPDGTIDAHVTQFFYSKPDQEELDRLFGTDVGYAAHYQKNTVIDPNGQVSISYLNLSGKPIATALAGAAPDGMETLDSFDNTPITASLLSPQTNTNIVDSSTHSLLLSETFVVTDKADYTFSYNLTGASFDLLTCSNKSYCLDCIYDLKIRLIDNRCGDVLFEQAETVGKISQLDDLCNNQAIREVEFSRNLDKGSYTIEKYLVVNQEAAEKYVNDMINDPDSKCVSTLESLIEEEISQTDFTLCDSIVIDTPIFVNQCEGYRMTMWQDVNPGGQYYGGNMETLDSTARMESHPEYCRLQFCNSWDASDRYDFELLQAETYQDAIEKGFIPAETLSISTQTNPGGSRLTTNLGFINQDPVSNLIGSCLLSGIFLDGSFSISNRSLMDVFHETLVNYQGTDKSIVEMAASAVNCPTEESFSTCSAQFGTSDNPLIRNAEWEMLRNLYFSVKQSVRKLATRCNEISGCSPTIPSGKTEVFREIEYLTPDSTLISEDSILLSIANNQPLTLDYTPNQAETEVGTCETCPEIGNFMSVFLRFNSFELFKSQEIPAAFAGISKPLSDRLGLESQLQIVRNSARQLTWKTTSSSIDLRIDSLFTWDDDIKPICLEALDFKNAILHVWVNGSIKSTIKLTASVDFFFCETQPTPPEEEDCECDVRWEIGYAYPKGTIVDYQGSCYEAKLHLVSPIDGQPPRQPYYWKFLCEKNIKNLEDSTNVVNDPPPPVDNNDCKCDEAWQQDTRYVAGAIVRSRGVCYKKNNYANDIGVVPSNSNNWELLCELPNQNTNVEDPKPTPPDPEEPCDCLTPWVGAQLYTRGSVVNYNGACYKATGVSTLVAPDSNPKKWTKLCEQPTDPCNCPVLWQTNRAYSPNEVVGYNGKCYRASAKYGARQGNRPDAQFTQWSVICESSISDPCTCPVVWQTTGTYTINQRVSFNGACFQKVSTANNNTVPSKSTYWQKICDLGGGVVVSDPPTTSKDCQCDEAWQQDREYRLGAIVRSRGICYERIYTSDDIGVNPYGNRNWKPLCNAPNQDTNPETPKPTTTPTNPICNALFEDFENNPQFYSDLSRRNNADGLYRAYALVGNVPVGSTSVNLGSNMLVFNANVEGNENLNTPALIYRKTVAVSPNTTYSLSLLSRLLSAASNRTLRVSINGQNVGSDFAADTPFGSRAWSSGNASQAEIKIMAVQKGKSIFALDNIRLQCSDWSRRPNPSRPGGNFVLKILNMDKVLALAESPVFGWQTQNNPTDQPQRYLPPNNCNDVLCNPDFVDMPPMPLISCEDQLTITAQNNAYVRYTQYVDSLSKALLQRYYAKCMGAAETLTKSYTSGEHHYTLYYYDQAGNVIKTIPPAGVNFLSGSQLAAVHDARLRNQNTIRPAHQMHTWYTFNSLNQSTTQNSPDAGESRFYYDYLGRIVLSQNAQQKIDKKLAYMRYDALGRAIEVGKASYYPANTDLKATAASPQRLAAYLQNNEDSRTEITFTQYDRPLRSDVATAFGSSGQQHLQNRIASVSYYSESEKMMGGVYDHATHYSYDISGNVSDILQDYGKLTSPFGRGSVRLQSKALHYDFDLISGKVNQVSYQAGAPDQWLHRYTYDADNRLTEVKTSRNGIIWQTDAHYAYYKHGPLARTVLGENKVQGLDHIYTLQGWIKGVNGSSESVAADAGRDGNTIALLNDAIGFSQSLNQTDEGYNGTNQLVARDAFGYWISYHQNDYKTIAQGNAIPQTFALASSGSYHTAPANLYNGNIRTMLTNLQGFGVQAFSYTYDQLNRIKQQNGFVPNGTQWTTNDAYKMALSYDANGNINTMLRNGIAANLAMDQLKYHYYNADGSTYTIGSPNTGTATNRLAYVKDAVAPAQYAEDIDNQNPGNYRYDAIGNLISDASEGISRIRWNMQNKVNDLQKTDGTQLSYHYDALGNRIAKILTPPYGGGAGGGVAGTGGLGVYYVRDAQGNVLATYAVKNDSLRLKDFTIYGSNRLGLVNTNLYMGRPTVLNGIPFENPQLNSRQNSLFKTDTLRTGHKQYELSNHLGNVLATISDKKVHTRTGNTLMFNPEVLSSTDYYAFGMALPGRSQAAEYRFGFNGKENDTEWGTGLIQDYGFRLYNPAVGRFLSVDPLTTQYPWYTPYQFAGNKPINSIDLDGLEEWPAMVAESTGGHEFSLSDSENSLNLPRKKRNITLKTTWVELMAGLFDEGKSSTQKGGIPLTTKKTTSQHQAKNKAENPEQNVNLDIFLDLIAATAKSGPKGSFKDIFKAATTLKKGLSKLEDSFKNNNDRISIEYKKRNSWTSYTELLENNEIKYYKNNYRGFATIQDQEVVSKAVFEKNYNSDIDLIQITGELKGKRLNETIINK